MRGSAHMAKSIFVLNGPNLNLLGQRQPDIYGRKTLADVEALCRARAERYGFDVTFRQSNHEGDVVDWLQEARQEAAGVIINPGAFTHTSIAILDAIIATELPVIEVHISNIHAREEFRRHSYVSTVAKAVLCGFGIEGYGLAIDGLAALLGARAQAA
jgi:3-dehydroquinate dehydratase-2